MKKSSTSLSLGKWKIKLEWNDISHQLKWLKWNSMSRIWNNQSSQTAGGNEKCCTTLENYLAVPYKVKHTPTLWFCHSTPTQEKWKHALKKTCIRISCSSLHNNSNLEATQIPINRKRNLQIVVHLYNGIQLSNKNEQIIYTCSNMSEYSKPVKEKNQTPQTMYSVFLWIWSSRTDSTNPWNQNSSYHAVDGNGWE